jgi:phage shock protein A
MRKHSLAGLLVAMALGLSLTACQDPFGSKARQENEQLKSQVAALQKENAELRSHVDELTTAHNGLMRENDELRAENTSLKAKRPANKTPGSRRK